MDRNLKSRLRLIRENGLYPAAVKTTPQGTGNNKIVDASWPEWTIAGFKLLKRKISFELKAKIPLSFSKSLALLVPDIRRLGRIPSPGELVFFDLETTGLSGGAGTIAFLAAFGRFAVSRENDVIEDTSPGKVRLDITQYLLLDYPGETDFIETAVKEFSVSLMLSAKNNDASRLPVVVSFNGKCFDSQILKTRCLMNGIMVPGYHHIDLLHPARRLWKNKLPDCSQATIEVSVLGIDRTGDVSGAMAPEIWFSYLKTGNNRELLSVCDHNARDITGLASLFLCLGEIAADPFESRNRFHLDEEALAITWTETLKKFPGFFVDEENIKGELLLKHAANNGCYRAAFMLALDYFRKDRIAEGRHLMKKTAADNSCQGSIRAAAFKSLAMDAEWRLGDLPLALEYTSSALAILDISGSLRKELEGRQLRLEGKIGSRN